MSFSVSPAVTFSEVDLTNVVPASAQTIAALAGVFTWGPIGIATLQSSENTLVANYGRPSNFNAETWFTAANFLAYSQNLYISRAANTSNANGTVSAVATPVANTLLQSNTYYSVLNNDDYSQKVTSNASYFAGQGAQWIAKYPGAGGNSLRISTCDSAEAFSSTINLKNFSHSNVSANAISANNGNTNIVFVPGSNQATVTLANSASGNDTNTTALGNLLGILLTVGDLIVAGNSVVGTQFLKITNIANVVTGNTIGTNTGIATVQLSFSTTFNLSSNVTQTVIQRNWEYFGLFDGAPGQSQYVKKFGNTAANDQLHVVVIDNNGFFTKNPGQILDQPFAFLSRATDELSISGQSEYYKNVLNQNSNYVWFADDRSGAVSNTAVNIVSSTNFTPQYLNFINGQDGASEATAAFGDIALAYDLFQDSSNLTISLVMTGKNDDAGVIGNYVINNLSLKRLDCVSFISPPYDAVVNNRGNEQAAVTAFRNTLPSTSYGFLDSGYGYQYDKYNDVNRYIPLNGHIAGLCARTDLTNNPWWSPAGYNRGILQNIIKLAWSPVKAQRDAIFTNQINPVITEKGFGTLLLGDSTLLVGTSAFNAIGVRRLFIVLEVAISTQAKFLLFEFNDDFTRAQFVALVTPYLKSIQSGRGITSFDVVCDDTNNTAQVIDNEDFIGDIYVVPARSIRDVQLNFIAAPDGVQFSEIEGNFGG